MPQSPAPPLKRLLSRAEALTLIGMTLTVLSLFLTWQQLTPSLPPSVTAIATFVAPTVLVSGFGLPIFVRVMLIGFAVLSSATLLASPSVKNQKALAAVQGICGLGCLMITLRYIAPLSGVGLGLFGSSLLIYAAVERYGETV